MITYDQAITADRFHVEGCREIVGPRGGVTRKVVEWRRNGKTKTWKTRPGEFSIPVKYGMYSYDTISHYEANRFHVESECPLKGESA